MAVLVVGGAGYIGSVTVEHLLKDGKRVIVLDDLSRGHREAVCEGAEFVEGDFGDATLVQATILTHGVESVVHFGASSLVGESVADPLTYYENNMGKAARLLRGCIAGGVKSFVFSSTAATFGEPSRTPIEEEDPQIPTNPYGRTKLYFEHVLSDCDLAYGLKSVCLRYFNAAGATERCGEHHDPETHLIPILLQVAAGQRDSVAVFGQDYPTRDGTCVRDYIHVADLADAHLLALAYLNRGGASTAFNLGNGQGFTVLEVIRAVEKVTGTRIPYNMGARRAGDPAVLIASSEKIQRELGWTPRYADLEEIVKSAWSWMQKHPQGYSPAA